MKPPPIVPPPARAEEPPLSLGDPSADAVLRSADREAAEEAGGLCGGENWTSLDRLISSTSTFDLTSFSLLLHKKNLAAFLYAWLASLCDDGGAAGLDAGCFGCCCEGSGSGSELCGDCCGADCVCC